MTTVNYHDLLVQLYSSQQQLSQSLVLPIHPFLDYLTTPSTSIPTPSKENATSPDSIGSERSSPDEILRVKRGRPQQDIHDDDDPGSQKRKHRRLYARQYRAQMRQRVDEVKSLKTELDELRRKLQDSEAELRRARDELCQKNILIGNLLNARTAF